MNPVQIVARQGQIYKRKGSGSLQYDGAFTEEKFAIANATGAQTDLAMVSGVANSKIRVISFAASGTTAATVVFNSKPAGAGSAISPLYNLTLAGCTTIVEKDDAGLFETAVGEGLSVTNSTGNVGYRITYILVD